MKVIKRCEPLPPSVPFLLANRSNIHARFPLRRPMDRRHSLLCPPFFQRLLSVTCNSYLPDNPSASFYRLYQFFVIDWTTQFRSELEYFWGQASWALADLPDPGLGNDGLPVEQAKLRRAVMAALTRIMQLAYNRLISEGLPRDAPAIVEDWDELKARPRILEQIPKWAEDVERLDPVVELPDADGKFLRADEEGDEGFARYGIKVCTPHWVFV